MDKSLNQPDSNIIICSWCGRQSAIIWVHGHGQCSNCGYNVDECCRGEANQNLNPENILDEETN